jgi:uncharacterized delta-60 repeat protein
MTSDGGCSSSVWTGRILLSSRSILVVAWLTACTAILGPAQPLGAAPGSLDPSFGNGGRVLTSLAQPNNLAQPKNDEAFAVVIQPDGKIVTAGMSLAEGGFDFALARYNPDGTLDGGFGTGGKVLTDFSQGSDDRAFAMALQPDGKIVVAGQSEAGRSDPVFALARYTSNGTLDTTFGNAGLVTTSFRNVSLDQARAVAIQPDGKIVATGFSFTNDSGSDFALARYNADGTLDSTFGSDGKVLTDFSQGRLDFANAVTIQSDGKIVAAGEADVNGAFRFALARYKADGTLDSTFGSDGKVLTDFAQGLFDGANAVTIQSDGKIVVAGVSYTSVPNPVFALARYDANGALDASFGTGGTVTTAFGARTNDVAIAVAIQSDGKVVAGGSSESVPFLSFALARYDANGALDTTFGSEGKVTTQFGTASLDEAGAMALQPDGNIVLVGASNANGLSVDFALARYLGASAPGPVLEVRTNRLAFLPGSSFQLDLVVGNSGAATGIDFYFGALLPPSAGDCPNNDPILFFTGGLSNFVVACLSASSPNIVPFARGVSLPAALPSTKLANFLDFLWPPGLAGGAYTFFAALTDTGTLNVRAIGTDTVTLDPIGGLSASQAP